ncbi:MAG: MmcQ/YjbR family DNA-binding protein [Rhodocyclaceae bacterium]|nr:MmcQ/YjbR family DNA-binding protein [Rhodocyclaceae bacterium]MBP7081189.1 MmcQ/YjbR family DNA-binding protein [Rhodocyclaceae bacterium]
MNTAQVKRFCSEFPGSAVTLHAAPSNVLVYAVGGKYFAYFKTSEPERWRFSFRVTPDRFLELTGIPDVKPARYMGRFHWVTVVNVEAIPSTYLRELVAWSYKSAVSKLTKDKRKQLGILAPT